MIILRGWYIHISVPVMGNTDFFCMYTYTYLNDYERFTSTEVGLADSNPLHGKKHPST